MRKFSAIALVSCLTLGATAVFAQTTPSTSMDKPATGATKTTATKTTTATTKTTKTTVKAHKVTGDITAIDCTTAPQKVTIKTTDLDVTATTKITIKGKKATCADLKKDDDATATYTVKDGKNEAKSINVTKS
jgi:hypothetical protein